LRDSINGLFGRLKEFDTDASVAEHEQDRPISLERSSVPGYELLGAVGRGGLGVVYKARHLALNRTVALKMISAGPHADQQELVRFRTEAEVMARLQHPNIVQIFEVGEVDGRPYLALEFVDGVSLRQRLAGTPLPAREAAALGEKLARAMHAVHGLGGVHRDLKPAHVLLTAAGTLKISNCGLAMRLDASGAHTQSGAIVGTPAYMAPEQAAGAPDLGPPADIHALGVILYEMLTGRRPFDGPTPPA